jgi:hypothetical protein
MGLSCSHPLTGQSLLSHALSTHLSGEITFAGATSYEGCFAVGSGDSASIEFVTFSPPGSPSILGADRSSDTWIYGGNVDWLVNIGSEGYSHNQALAHPASSVATALGGILVTGDIDGVPDNEQVTADAGNCGGWILAYEGCN